MHTLRIKTKDFGEVAVLHHGDWTGTAKVVWYDDYKERQEVELPASLLLAIGKKSAVAALTKRVSSCIEDWDPGQMP